MAQIDLAERSVTLKIVYCGPALSGKTTNILALHGMLPEHRRGRLQMIDDENQRTVFFDFTPIDAQTRGGYHISFRVFTVSGQENESDARAAVLAGADGVVFVADVSFGRLEDNRQSMDELRDQLRVQDSTSNGRVPIVVQYNKLDLGDREAPANLRPLLEVNQEPVVFASAAEQRGVAETFETICRLATRSV